MVCRRWTMMVDDEARCTPKSKCVKEANLRCGGCLTVWLPTLNWQRSEGWWSTSSQSDGR
eukprot:scaffold1054_cov281-Alexandrium_tamarense.AAC.4